MIGILVLAGVLVGAPVNKVQKSDGVLEKIERWMDTARTDYGKTIETGKGKKSTHFELHPTYYPSPFGPPLHMDWDHDINIAANKKGTTNDALERSRLTRYGLGSA